METKDGHTYEARCVYVFLYLQLILWGVVLIPAIVVAASYSCALIPF